MSSEESKQNNKEQNTGFNPFGSFPAELSNESNTNTTSNQQSGQNGFEGFTFSDNIFASFPTALSQPSNNNDTSSTEQNTSFTFTFTDNSFSQPQEGKIENKESENETNKSEPEPASNDGTSNIFSSFPAAFTTTSNNSPQNNFGSVTFTDTASKQADNTTNSTEPEIIKENEKTSEKDETSNQETKQENLFASFPAALTKSTNSDIESSHLNQPNEFGSFVFNDNSIQQKSETKEDEVTKTPENDLSTAALAKSSIEDTIKETNDEINDNSQSSNTSNKDDAFSSFPAAFSKSSNDNSTDKHNPFAFTDPTTNNSQQNQSDNNETTKPESNNKINHQQSSSDDEQPNLFASFPAALSKASSNSEQSSHNGFESFTTSKQNEDQQNNLTLTAQSSSNQQANDDSFASFPGNITAASQNKSSDLFSDFAFSDSFAKTESDAAKKEESKEDIFSSFAAALSSSSSNQVMDSNHQNESFTFTDNSVSPKHETPSIKDPATTKEETSKEIDDASKDSDVNDQEKKQDDFFSSFPAALIKSSSNSNSPTPNNQVSFTDLSAKEEARSQSIEKAQENDKSSSSTELSPKSSSQQDDFFSSFPAALIKLSSNSNSTTPSNPVVFNDLPTQEEAENQSIEKVQEDPSPQSSSQHEDFFSSFPATFSTPTKNETESEEPKSPKEDTSSHENIQLETKSSNKETESLPNDLQSHSPSGSFGEFSFSETASNPFVSPPKETTPKSDTQQEKQDNQSNNDDSLEKIGDNDEPKGNFTFSFTPTFESNTDAESNKDNQQKIDTSINMEDFKGFSFTPAEGDASFGNFTFTFPASNETATNDANSIEQDKPSVSFGDFHPFEGFTFTPATPAQNEEIVNKAEEQTIEQEQPSKPKRKPRSVNTSSVSSGDNIDSKEQDTYQSVEIGDYSFSAFQNLINNPIFKLDPTDVTNYFDANDETNTIDGALNYLKSHTVQ